MSGRQIIRKGLFMRRLPDSLQGKNGCRWKTLFYITFFFRQLTYLLPGRIIRNNNLVVFKRLFFHRRQQPSYCLSVIICRNTDGYYRFIADTGKEYYDVPFIYYRGYQAVAEDGRRLEVDKNYPKIYGNHKVHHY